VDVEKIFSEENIHYEVDSKGGVHFRFDKEFAQVTAAAISILQKPRYANSLDAFNKALAALAQGPDGKGAIRSTFTAIEGLFALMFPDVQRLAAGEVSRLRPSVEQVYSGDRRAQEAQPKDVAIISRLDRRRTRISTRRGKTGHRSAAALDARSVSGQCRRRSFALVSRT
jgi:hypothetical protein